MFFDDDFGITVNEMNNDSSGILIKAFNMYNSCKNDPNYKDWNYRDYVRFICEETEKSSNWASSIDLYLP